MMFLSGTDKGLNRNIEIQMGRINAEDKLNMLIKRQSSYCVEKQESTTEYFQKINSAEKAAKESGSPAYTQQDPTEGRELRVGCLSIRLKSPEQYELLMREGAVPAITDTKWQMSMPINDKSS